MSRRDTIDSMTAGETILLAANTAALSAPASKSHFAMMALVAVTRKVVNDICQPQHTNMVHAATAVGEWAEHRAGKSSDEFEQDVYIAVYQSAYDFAQALDYNLSMEAPSLPF